MAINNPVNDESDVFIVVWLYSHLPDFRQLFAAELLRLSFWTNLCHRQKPKPRQRPRQPASGVSCFRGRRWGSQFWSIAGVAPCWFFKTFTAPTCCVGDCSLQSFLIWVFNTKSRRGQGRRRWSGSQRSRSRAHKSEICSEKPALDGAVGSLSFLAVHDDEFCLLVFCVQPAVPQFGI